MFLEVSNCKIFHEVYLGRWFAIFTIATVTSLLFRTLASPYSFCWGLVKRFFFCGWMNGQSFPIWHLSFLRYLQCVDANNHTLDHDYNFLFCSWNTEDDLLFQMDFSLSFWRWAFLQKLSLITGLLDRCPGPFPFFVGSCSKEHVPPFEHERLDVHERQSLLLSSAPSKKYTAAARFLERSFGEINMFCCWCSRMSLSIVLNFW